MIMLSIVAIFSTQSVFTRLRLWASRVGGVITRQSKSASLAQSYVYAATYEYTKIRYLLSAAALTHFKVDLNLIG